MPTSSAVTESVTAVRPITFQVVTWKSTACCSTAGCFPPDRCGRLRGTGLARGSAGVTGFEAIGANQEIGASMIDLQYFVDANKFSRHRVCDGCQAHNVPGGNLEVHGLLQYCRLLSAR